MLTTVAVVPGPPALVPELMGSAAHELDDLRSATDRVVFRALADLAALMAGSPGSGSGPGPAGGSEGGSATGPPGGSAAGSGSPQLVVVGPGRPGEFNAAGPVSFDGFGREVVLPGLVEGKLADHELPTPIMVARYLAGRDIAAHPEHAGLWASARWVTTGGAAATALGEQLRQDRAAVGLILVGDGAACHGPKAPRAQDTRAQSYDDAVCAALASGRPSRLAQLDGALGDELGATGSQLWPVLTAAAGGDTGHGCEWLGELLWSGAPFGVGWAVASWRSQGARSCR